MKPLISKTYSWESFPCQTSLKSYAKAFVLIFVKVTHYSDYLCKSPLIQALLNDLLNVTSMLKVFFFFPPGYWFICSTHSFCEHWFKKKKKSGHCVFIFLSFKWGLLSSVIICQGCNCVYSGWDQISEQEELKELLRWG